MMFSVTSNLLWTSDIAKPRLDNTSAELSNDQCSNYYYVSHAPCVDPSDTNQATCWRLVSIDKNPHSLNWLFTM